MVLKGDRPCLYLSRGERITVLIHCGVEGVLHGNAQAVNIHGVAAAGHVDGLAVDGDGKLGVLPRGIVNIRRFGAVKFNLAAPLVLDLELNRRAILILGFDLARILVIAEGMVTAYGRTVQLVNDIADGVILCHSARILAVSGYCKGQLVAIPQPVAAVGLGKAAAALVLRLGRAKNHFRHSAADLNLTVRASFRGGKCKALGGLGVGHLHSGLFIGIDVGQNVRQLGVLSVGTDDHIIQLKLILLLTRLFINIQNLNAELILLLCGRQGAQLVSQQLLQGLAGVQIGGSGLANAQGLARAAVDNQAGTFIRCLEFQL